MEKKRWYRQPNVRQEERKTLKEELRDPGTIFLGLVVGVLWLLWYATM